MIRLHNDYNRGACAKILEKLAKEYTFEQERTLDDGRRVVRFCTSWATTEAEKNQLIGDIRKL